VNRISTARRIILLLFMAGSPAFAQSPALPATNPTAAVPTNASAAAPRRAQPAAHRAQIVYSKGQLQILANDSSLNQILREIARQTGMKISGGIADERVFGNYGPGAPALILASLIQGTGSNMILRETASHAPAELILTPRGGGPTPPNPNAPSFDDDEDNSPASQQSPTGQPPASQTRTATGSSSGTPPQPPLPPSFLDAPTGIPSTNAGTPFSTTSGTTSGTTPPPTNPSLPQSPNGVKTPQQIVQQQQQLQSQP
jgi:hypothetical protein